MNFGNSLTHPDAVLGLDLDDVLMGDAGIATELLIRPTVTRGAPRRAVDIAWGSWRERELRAYQKRCERKAKRWNAKMAKNREKLERESRESMRRDEKRRQMDLLRREVPAIKVYVYSSIPDWWAMWSLLWIDVGWCMKTLGERGIATNRAELIRKGVTTIFFTSDSDMPVCGMCLAKSTYLVSIFYVIVRCVPCWMRRIA